MKRGRISSTIPVGMASLTVLLARICLFSQAFQLLLSNQKHSCIMKHRPWFISKSMDDKLLTSSSCVSGAEETACFLKPQFLNDIQTRKLI